MILGGKKHKEWVNARKRLERTYLLKGITRCERCGSAFGLSFHHLNKRSSGRASHTFRGTRLLCLSCHEKAEYDEFINNWLKKLR